MTNINNNETKSLNLSQTTITIKRGTKTLLDSLGTRQDSYDDIIRKLINENKEFRNELSKFPEQLNKITISNLKRKKSTFSFEDYKIFFEYNLPVKPLDGFYFDIQITKITKNEESSKEIFNDPIHFAKAYFEILGKLLKQHIDPLFKLNEKKILNLEWWKQKLHNLGFTKETYTRDIENKLIEFGVTP